MVISLSLIPAVSPYACDNPALEEDAGKDLYPAIQKVSNNFYTSKIAGKELNLVLERIDERTHPLWLHYGSQQSSSYATELAKNGIEGKVKVKNGVVTFPSDLKRVYHSTATGASLFSAILKEVPYKDKELWIAYITKATSPQPIPNHIKGYQVMNCIEHPDPFAKDIEMFVTVISSPQALFTCHKGIAMSVEAAIGERTRGISVDLHSFAAKVMSMRNPERRFMMNTPVFAMEKIMTDALPGSVFVGTREMQQMMKERQKISLEEFTANNEKVLTEIEDELKKRAQEECDGANKKLQEQLILVREGKIQDKSEKVIRQEEAEIISSRDTMIEMGEEGVFVVSEEKIALALSEKFLWKYSHFKDPFSFDVHPLTGLRQGESGTSSEKFLQYMEKHPQLLSVDRVSTIHDQFTIFDPEVPSEPWLSVDRTNPSYRWIFEDYLRPMGTTHYIVVDLKDLANSRSVE